jgi:2-polyprenyl-3-methyl-5-hydroxy-6-metoxy-1,4-benzoquinol methylase
MKFSLKVFLYRKFIDPLLSGLRREILLSINPKDRILEIACGTGALAIAMASKAAHVTAIDLSEENIAAATSAAIKKGAGDIKLEVRDASDLSCYPDLHFDVAVITMAVHQFDPEQAITILSEMRKKASQIIIGDYSHHMRSGWGRNLAWVIEWLAGGDHYRNFRNYIRTGGLHFFASKAGLDIINQSVRGGGVFVIAICK